MTWKRMIALAALGAFGLLATPALAEPPVRFSVVETAVAKGPEGYVLEGGNWFHERELSTVAFLIEHPRGRMLIDTGFGKETRAQMATFPWWVKPLFPLPPFVDTATLLGRHGLTPGAIDRVLVSHMHFDHASAIEDFPRSEIWVTEEEFNWAQLQSPPVAVRESFDAPGIRWHFMKLENRPYEGFMTSLDLYGDGTVVAVGLPGHTPGSVGVFVNLASGKRIFLTGDTTWTAEGFDRHAGRSWIPRQIVDNDEEGVLRAIAQIAALKAREPEIKLVPAHDRRAQLDLAHFPDYEE